MVLNRYIFTKKNLHLSILFRIERRRIYCPTRYHSHFVIFTHSPDTEPSDSYILPFVTAGIPSASTLFLLYRRFWTAAPRWVPDIPSAVSHHPTALWNQVCMYYSSSTLFLSMNKYYHFRPDLSRFFPFPFKNASGILAARCTSCIAWHMNHLTSNIYTHRSDRSK